MRNINLPVALFGVLWIPPATGVNYASFLVVGAIFQFYLRRMRFAWWSKVCRSATIADASTTTFSPRPWMWVRVYRRCLPFSSSSFPKLRSIGGETTCIQTVRALPSLADVSAMDWNGTAVRLVAPEEGFGPTEWP